MKDLFSREEEDILDALHTFTYEKVAELVDDLNGPDPATALGRAMAALGEAGHLTFLLGGLYRGELQDPGLVHAGMLVEVTAVQDPGLALALIAHLGASAMLYRHGSREITDPWLEDLAGGRKLAALAVAEDDAGLDLDDLTTTLTADGDGFRLNGTKNAVSAGAIADLILVACGGPTPALVAVPGTAEGIGREAVGDDNAIGVARLTFTDVRLPAAAVLLEGETAPLDLLLDELRTLSAAATIGLTWRAAALIEAHARRPAGDHPPPGTGAEVWRPVAEIAVHIEGAIMLALQAGRLHDRGKHGPAFRRRAAIARLAAARAAEIAAEHAGDLTGAVGLAGPHGASARLIADVRRVASAWGSDHRLAHLVASQDLAPLKLEG